MRGSGSRLGWRVPGGRAGAQTPLGDDCLQSHSRREGLGVSRPGRWPEGREPGRDVGQPHAAPTGGEQPSLATLPGPGLRLPAQASGQGWGVLYKSYKDPNSQTDLRWGNFHIVFGEGPCQGGTPQRGRVLAPGPAGSHRRQGPVVYCPLRLASPSIGR